MKIILLLLTFVATSLLADDQKHDAHYWNSLIGRGVNLGNALDAPKEGAWGVTLEKKYFDLIAEAGFDSVRIPVRWSAHAGDDAPYSIDADFLKRADWAIEQALARKLVAIINIHHYDEIYLSPEKHKERLFGLWQQLAEHYKDYPETLYFEVLNEPNGKLTNELWNQYAAELIPLIRKSNPKRAIVVGPGQWNNVTQLTNLVLPREDRNIIVTFHYYLPFKFTHQGASWIGEKSKQWLGTQWTETDQEKQELINHFDAAQKWAKANDRPLYLGEFGAYHKADFNSRVRWTAFVRSEAEKRQISWAYWEFCAGFGIYDRKAGEWRRGLLKSLLPARSGASASQRILDSAKNGVVLIAAHRGGYTNDNADQAPENTVANVAVAIKKGYDVFETDIQRTSDGIFVAVHDPTIERETDGSGEVMDLTLAQLKSLKKRYRDGAVSEERVATLEELLLAGKDKILFKPDLKPGVIDHFD